MDDETDKVIMLAKGGYVSENPISSQGIARALRNHGYRGGVVIVEDWNQKDISDEETSDRGQAASDDAPQNQ